MELLQEEQQKLIIAAIKRAENNTSGEIKVHIEANCNKSDAIDRAKYIFKYLALHKTALRNGVLFYLAYEDRKFAIIGDSGINDKVGQQFWDSTKSLLIQNFKESKFTEGLVKGIEEAGIQLEKYFPFNSDDTNEISDEISFG